MNNKFLERREYYRKKAERNLYLLTSQSLYAEYLILTGEYDKALLVSLKGLLNSPWFLRLQVDLGLSYLLKNELNSAEEEFKHALKIDPENPLAHLFLALTYIKMDRLKEAEATLKSGFEYNPDVNYIRDLLICIYEKQGKTLDITGSEFEKIEEKVKEGFISSSSVLRIKEEKGENIPYELLYAISLMQEDKMSEAISVLEKILIYHPYYPKALYNLGKVYSIIGDNPRKEENWKKAFEVNPLLPELKEEAKNIESVHIDINDLSEMRDLEKTIVEYTLKEFKSILKSERIEKPQEELEISEKTVAGEETPETSTNEQKPQKPLEEKIPEEVIVTEEEIPEKIEEKGGPLKELEIQETEEVSQQEETSESEVVKETFSDTKGKGVEYFKNKGMEYLKKRMYREAIEMFTKALKEGKEKI
ncbi:MAG: tetratricopeptide repeat protein [Caldisericia bacterium]|nr:tetratricopeptide repeat protein [Caldisericia bacterium]